MVPKATPIPGTPTREVQDHVPGGRARPWAIFRHLSSVARHSDTFIERHPFERGNWLVVAYAAGIALWLGLKGPFQWVAVLAGCGATLAGSALLHRESSFGWLRMALLSIPLMVAAGLLTVWGKSALVGTPGIARPMVALITGRVEERREQGAESRVRLTLITHLPDRAEPVRVRVNLAASDDLAHAREGALVRLRARLMPPAPPLLPGSFDFARSAWFAGIAATGTVIGKPEIIRPAEEQALLAEWRRRLSAHIRAQITGPAGAIATAFATGDRGEIGATHEQAMRDSGLTHLLSISGLHVSAVVAAAFALTLRLLGLWPWLALRTRLPLVAASSGALTGIGYTLLTGAEVPTIRSCIGAVLVLLALALGREPLSLRMVAVAAFFVLLFWPEALFGPSFQMSFAAVTAIVSLHNSELIRAFTKSSEEWLPLRVLRHLALLLLTGIVIELALMPIGLFHFHRAGVYGALANVIAIPLTTFITMPLIAIALVLDLAGGGWPAWWTAGKSIELLLWLAEITAAQPGSVKVMPPIAPGTFALFVMGGVWIALWSGRIRWLGLVPLGLGCLQLLTLRPADLLVSGDGRQVGLTLGSGELLVLREGRGDYVRSQFLEIAGRDGETIPLAQWPGAKCNRDFCAITLEKRKQSNLATNGPFHLLIARGRDRVDEMELAAACERADIVIAERRLPRSCTPRWLKADRAMLSRTGGIAVDFERMQITTVSQGQGQHGWYRWRKPQGRADKRQPVP